MQHLKLGDVKDMDKYLYLGAMAYEESPVRGVFDINKARNYMRDLLTKPLEQVCPLLVEEDGIPIGLFIGTMIDDPFSSNRFAIENHWYVLPNKRKGACGLTLLKAFEYWAQTNGADAIYISSGTNPTLAKLLERRHGYTPKISVMIKELENGN